MIFAISIDEARDAAEPEHRGNQRNDQKCQSPTKHGVVSSNVRGLLPRFSSNE